MARSLGVKARRHIPGQSARTTTAAAPSHGFKLVSPSPHNSIADPTLLPWGERRELRDYWSLPLTGHRCQHLQLLRRNAPLLADPNGLELTRLDQAIYGSLRDAQKGRRLADVHEVMCFWHWSLLVTPVCGVWGSVGGVGLGVNLFV